MGVALTNDTLETSIEEIVEKQKSSYLSNRKLLNMKKYNHCYIFILYRSVKCTRQKRNSKTMIVEASCGQCQFGMKGYACDLQFALMENRIL
jgi:hypothetical protein